MDSKQAESAAQAIMEPALRERRGYGQREDGSRTARLVVRRQQGAWQDVARSYSIILDGRKVGQVANNDEVVIPVTPGPHRLRLAIDWCGSPELDFSVADGQAAVFECGPAANILSILLYVTIWNDRYIRLRRADAAAAG